MVRFLLEPCAPGRVIREIAPGEALPVTSSTTSTTERQVTLTCMCWLTATGAF